MMGFHEVRLESMFPHTSLDVGLLAWLTFCIQEHLGKGLCIRVVIFQFVVIGPLERSKIMPKTLKIKSNITKE